MRRWLKRGAWAFGVMLVVAVFVLPKVNHVYWKTRAKQHEAALPSLLSALRTAIDSFRAAHRRFPKDLREPAFVEILRPLVARLGRGPGYDFDSDGIPRLELFTEAGRIPGHPLSSQVEIYPFRGEKGEVDPMRLKDSGHWLYEPRTGRVLIDCTHHPAVASWVVPGRPIYEW